MIIRIERKKHGFSIIANEPLRDKRLSYRARGVLAYLLTRPDNWEVKMEEVTANGTEGRDAIRKVMRELEHFGYASLEPCRGKGGKVVGRSWVVKETPNTTESLKIPTSVKTERRKNRTSEKPNVGKSGDIIITDSEAITEKEEITERESARAKNASPLETETPLSENERSGGSAAVDYNDSPCAKTPLELEAGIRAFYIAHQEEWRAGVLENAGGRTYTDTARKDIVKGFCEWAIDNGRGNDTFSRLNARLQKWFRDQKTMRKDNTTTTAQGDAKPPVYTPPKRLITA